MGDFRGCSLAGILILLSLCSTWLCYNVGWVAAVGFLLFVGIFQGMCDFDSEECPELSTISESCFMLGEVSGTAVSVSGTAVSVSNEVDEDGLDELDENPEDATHQLIADNNATAGNSMRTHYFSFLTSRNILLCCVVTFGVVVGLIVINVIVGLLVDAGRFGTVGPIRSAM